MKNRTSHWNTHGWLAATLAGAMLLAPVPALAQQAFTTAEAAADAFADALSRNDAAAMRRVLGKDWRRYFPKGEISGSEVSGFLSQWAASHKIVADNAQQAHLVVGAEAWVLPIPIVARKGAWRFDLRAGADEIRTRRIGANELDAIQAVLAYYDAQKEYARQDYDGDGVLEYAQKITSTPGLQDGLYWGALPGEAPSPLGALYGEVSRKQGYHGYRYRILAAQGGNAPGGAYDYRIKGNMVAGFALVAWPVRYGETGVMSFMISHDGTVVEKNLGARGETSARAMSRFAPDDSWRKVKP